MIFNIFYFIVLLGWVFLILGFAIKSYPITILSAFLIMIFGIYILINGLPSNDFSLLDQGVGFINAGIGGYVALRGTYEQINFG